MNHSPINMVEVNPHIRLGSGEHAALYVGLSLLVMLSLDLSIEHSESITPIHHEDLDRRLRR